MPTERKEVKTRAIQLEELKPCMLCGGKIAPVFYEVTIRHAYACISVRAVNELLGLAQFFQGSLGLAKVFAPNTGAATVLEEPEATTRAFVCVHCYCTKQVVLGELAELAHSAVDVRKEPCGEEVGGRDVKAEG